MVKFITVGCDFFFNALGFGAHDGKQGYNFQLFLCLLNVILSTWPLVCYVIYTSDIHVVLWLGNVPQYVNLAVPILLVCLNIGVNMFQCMHFSGPCARIGCFCLFLVLGAILVAMGGFVFAMAEAKAAELLNKCGTTPLPRKIEGTWIKLNKFYEKCDPTRKKDIVTCEGYSEAFPNRVFVDYLEELEYTFDCVGFCKFWAKPIFNADANPATRCASAVGTHLQTVSFSVGMPTAVLGLIFIVIGVLLSGYDHL